ncbi:MAG: hypothetical protein EZS28_045656, partial [Streblomastix strix]
WEYAQFDPVKDGKKVEWWEHTFFDPEKDDERTQQVDQVVNQEIMTRINKRVLSTHLVGFPFFKRVTNTCVIHDSGIEDIQEIWINYQLEKHQYPENISIGGRLYNFIDAWKLIGADSLITKGINTFQIDTQAHYILEINTTNIMKIRSKDIELAQGKLILQEFQQDIIEKESVSQIKWVDPCFAIPKSVSGKWRKNIDCSLLNKFLCAKHYITEDFQSLQSNLRHKNWMIKIDLESAFHNIQVVNEQRPFLCFCFNQKYFLCVSMCFEKISINKSFLELKRKVEFLRWKIDSELEQLQMTDHRQKKLIQILDQWRTFVKKKTV